MHRPEPTSNVIDRLDFRPRLDRQTRRNAELMGLLAQGSATAGRRRARTIRGSAVVGLFAAGIVLGAVLDASTRSPVVALGLVTSVLCLAASAVLAVLVRPPARCRRRGP